MYAIRTQHGTNLKYTSTLEYCEDLEFTQQRLNHWKAWQSGIQVAVDRVVAYPNGQEAIYYYEPVTEEELETA